MAGGLSQVLPICIGARVMLTTNLWIEKGLVNGSVGTVEDVACDFRIQNRPCDEPHKRPPAVLMVRFDSYTGPPYYTDDPDRATVVPIFRQESRHIFDPALTLGGIMFDAPFDHPSMGARVTPERDPRQADVVRRQNYHLPADAGSSILS
ncbi:hypothetical protein E4U58_004979 [Claviceps cyperi]|nr:hypothetical protein E4U58_004979 [Claviceps cyperi]